MLIGATARDVALADDGQYLARRATDDVDVAIAVTGHDSFLAVTSTLEPVPKAQHKFLVAGVDVDIVPFGDIESDERTVTWADGFVMNTLGLAEALPSALTIDLGAGLSIRVATLAAQAALKTFAWADRSSWTTRDGADLGTLIDAYSQRNRLDEVYATHNEELLAGHDYDVTLVGAHLLGRDIRAAMGMRVAHAAAVIVDQDLGHRQRLPGALRLRYPDRVKLLATYRDGLTGS